MTNAQILGVVSLVAGVGLYLQRRNTATVAAASTDSGAGSGADLWPDLPSVLGSIGDRFNYLLSGKQSGNTPAVASSPSSEPINVAGWTPTSADQYLPLSPLNPQNVGIEPADQMPQGGDPNLEPWNEPAYADLAWFKAPGVTFAPAPPGTEEYLSPGA